MRRRLLEARGWAEFLGEVSPAPGVTLEGLLSELQYPGRLEDPLVMAWWAVRYCAGRETEHRAIAGELADRLRPWCGGEGEWNRSLGELLAEAISRWERDPIDPGQQRWVGPIHIHAGLTRQRIPVLARLLGSLAEDPGLGHIQAVGGSALQERIAQHSGGLRFFPSYLQSDHGQRALWGLALLIHETGWPGVDWRSRLPRQALPGLPEGYLQELLEAMSAGFDTVGRRPASLGGADPAAGTPTYVLRVDGPDGCRLGLHFPLPGVTGHRVEGLAEWEARGLADRAFVPIHEIRADDALRLSGRCGMPAGSRGAANAGWRLPRWPADEADVALFGPDGGMFWRRGEPLPKTTPRQAYLVLPEALAADSLGLDLAELEEEQDLGWLDLIYGGGDWRVAEVRVIPRDAAQRVTLAWEAGAPTPCRGTEWLTDLRAWCDGDALLLDAAGPVLRLWGWTRELGSICDVQLRRGRPGGIAEASDRWEDVTERLRPVLREGRPTMAELPLDCAEGGVRVRGRGLRRGDPALNVRAEFYTLERVSLRTDRVLYDHDAGGRVEIKAGRDGDWELAAAFEEPVQGGVRVQVPRRGGELVLRVPVHHARLDGPRDANAGGLGWSDLVGQVETDRQTAGRVPRWRLQCRPGREGALWLVPSGRSPGPGAADLPRGGTMIHRLDGRQRSTVVLTHADLWDAVRAFRDDWPEAIAGEFLLQQQGSVARTGAGVVMEDRLGQALNETVGAALDGMFAPIWRALGEAVQSPAAVAVADAKDWPAWAQRKIGPWREAAAHDLAGPSAPAALATLADAVSLPGIEALPEAWKFAAARGAATHCEPRMSCLLGQYESLYGYAQSDRRRGAAFCRSLRQDYRWDRDPQARSLLLLCRIRGGDLNGLQSDLTDWLVTTPMSHPPHNPARLDPAVGALMRLICPTLPAPMPGTDRDATVDWPKLDHRWIAVLRGDAWRPGDDWLAHLVALWRGDASATQCPTDRLPNPPYRNPFWTQRPTPPAMTYPLHYEE